MSDRPPRLDARHVLGEVAEELFSLDRGLPFTLWQLVRHPGSSVRRYVEWRDPRMTRPFRLAIGSLAFAALAFTQAGVDGDFAEAFRAGMNETRPEARPEAEGGALAWVLAQLQWLLLIVWVPATAAAINRAYRRLGLNLAEQCTIALYAFVPILLGYGIAVLLPLPGASANALLPALVSLLPSLWGAWVMHRYARPERLSPARMLAFAVLQWLFATVLLLCALTGSLMIDLLWLRG